MINYFNLLLSPINTIKYFLEQKKFYQDAKLSNQDFLQKFPELKNLELATSWSNEEYLNLVQDSVGAGLDPALPLDKVLDGLKFIVEELGIKNIRLRLTWQDLELENGNLQIKEIDKKVFEYLFSQKVRICLNIGPIKCFRYPEMHLPQRVFALEDTPKEKEHFLSEESLIAKESLVYLKNLCKLIRSNFDEVKFDKYVKMIQLDNEPKSRFGLHKWLLSDEYMVKTFLIAEKFFPKQKYLINSPFIPYDWTELLEPDLQHCLNLVKKLPQTIQNKIILGINFYNFVPNIPKLPFFNIHPDNYSAFEAMFGSLQKTLRDLPFVYEVTESQFEDWGDKYPFNLPGNSAEHLRYTLLRHARKLLPANRGKKLRVSLWGIERFLVKQKDNGEIIDLIKILKN